MKFSRVKSRSEGVREKDERRQEEERKKSQRFVSAWGSMWNKVTGINVQVLSSSLCSIPPKLSVVSPVHTNCLVQFGFAFKRTSRKGPSGGICSTARAFRMGYNTHTKESSVDRWASLVLLFIICLCSELTNLPGSLLPERMFHRTLEVVSNIC